MGLGVKRVKPTLEVENDRRVVIAKKRYNNAIQYRIGIEKSLEEAKKQEQEAATKLKAIETVVAYDDWYEPDPVFDQT